MAAPLSGSEYKLMLCLMHYTLGYHRDLASISLTTFCWHTNLSRPTVIKGLRSLEQLGIVRPLEGGRTNHKAAVFQLNQDPETWPTGKYRLHLTGQQRYTCKTSKTLPAEIQTFTRSGKHPTSDASENKDKRVALKDKTIHSEKSHSFSSSFSKGASPLRNPLPRRGEGTKRERVTAFIKEYGAPATPAQISAATGLDNQSVIRTLQKHKNRHFLHFKDRHAWTLLDSTDANDNPMNGNKIEPREVAYGHGHLPTL